MHQYLERVKVIKIYPLLVLTSNSHYLIIKTFEFIFANFTYRRLHLVCIPRYKRDIVILLVTSFKERDKYCLQVAKSEKNIAKTTTTAVYKPYTLTATTLPSEKHHSNYPYICSYDLYENDKHDIRYEAAIFVKIY